MHQLAQTLASTTAFQAYAAPRADITDNEGKRVRLAAAELFGQGRQAEADLLTHAALLHYPDSEDVLVIRALICEVQQDWDGAAIALERLAKIQGQCAPVQTWCHWVRVLRCNGELDKARTKVLLGLQSHPAHPLLASELAQLEAMGSQADRQAA